MLILGVDVGYSHTKVASVKGTDIFLSTMKEGSKDTNKNSIVVEYQGKTYTIGSRDGKISSAIDKIEDLNFQLCLYTAIARQMKGTTSEIKLVTGLPVQYYDGQKDELLDALAGKKVEIALNGKRKEFTITEVIVFPQSAGLFALNPDAFENTENLVVDIGGKTVDVSLFDGMDLVKSATYELGVLSLYGDLVQRIKAVYKVSYDKLKAENIIKTKTITNNNLAEGSKDIDVSKLVNEMLADHVDSIMREVESDFKEFVTARRIYIGGGSYLLQKELGLKVKKDNIFSNALAFYQIGVESFED